jgi:hypothetical protein
MDFHIYVHFDQSDSKLDKILFQIGVLSLRMAHMDAATQAALTNLGDAVAEQTTIETSVETLLNGLSAQILDLKNQQTDPAVVAALQSAADLVNSNNAKFKAAVVANTQV